MKTKFFYCGKNMISIDQIVSVAFCKNYFEGAIDVTLTDGDYVELDHEEARFFLKWLEENSEITHARSTESK